MTPKAQKGSIILQYVAAFNAILSILCDGMMYGWSSPSIPQLKDNATCTLCMNEQQGSILAVMPFMGDITGALFAAAIVDALGRKRTILATSIPYIVSWLIIAFTNNVILLYISRYIAGMSDGIAYTAVPMYIGEIADPKIRGLLGTSLSVAWVAGFLVMNVMGSYLSIKATALLSIVFPLVLFITFIWMPESPYHLLMKGHPEDAKKSLRRLKGTKDIQDDLEEIRVTLEAEESRSGKFMDLFTVKSNRKAVYIVMILRGFQQLSGTSAIALYTHEIFQAGGSDFPAHYSVMIYYSIQLVLTIVSSHIVDRLGRRPLLLISLSGSALALFVEGTYFYILNETSIDTSTFSFVATLGLLVFVIIFSFGMQAVPGCMLGELFPTNVKAFALCLADVFFSLAATIATEYLEITKVEYGLHVSFFGFTICSTIGLVLIYFFVPETKGKTLGNIQVDLKKCNNT